jgi:hypothetical protein
MFSFEAIQEVKFQELDWRFLEELQEYTPFSEPVWKDDRNSSSNRECYGYPHLPSSNCHHESNAEGTPAELTFKHRIFE